MILIIGVGAVGGFIAQHLAAMDIGPLLLLDRKNLDYKNPRRHVLGRQYIGRSKSRTLAHLLRWEFPECKAEGIHKDFLLLPPDEQHRLIAAAEVVIAATDTDRCQRKINEVCFKAEVTAVYPGIWGHPDTRPAEVGQILWVLSGGNTPCYECAIPARSTTDGPRTWEGTRADVELLAITTAQLTKALLLKGADQAEILDTNRTMTLVHGFTPTSPSIRGLFHAGRVFHPDQGLCSYSTPVPFPVDPCRVCGVTSEPILYARPTAGQPTGQGTVRSGGMSDGPIASPPPDFTDYAWNARVDRANRYILRLTLWAEGHLETFPDYV